MRSLVHTVRDLKCNLLKVPHHGSKSSSSDLFLSRTRPATAIVTCGRGNPYGHPSDEVMDRYAQRGIRVLRTDRDGAISIRTRRDRLAFLQENDRKSTRISLYDRTNWGKTERLNQNKLLVKISEL